jgi:hypothetical protein
MSAMPRPAASLLAEIDPLAYPDRMRLLAMRARALAASGELAPVLDDLYRGDRFQRELAVFMAIVSSHQPTIVAALADPDWSIHRAAVSAWLRSGAASAAEIAALAADASWHSRRHVYRVLRRYPELGVADELIEAVWGRFGDAEAAKLLPACSPGTLARLLPELGHAAADWSLLGKRHPEVVVSEAGRQLAELTLPDRARWWECFGAGVLAAAPAVPQRVLDLLERYGPAATLPGPLHRYTRLAAADPARLIALITAPRRARWLEQVSLPESLLRHLAGLDTAALAPVARRLREQDRALAALLDAVPPARRAALYDEAYAGMDRSQARPSDQILDVLPRTRRWAEARRVLDLGPVRDDVALTLHYTAFLPWEQAKGPLTDATRRALADDRAAGYELMLGCAARTADADVVTEVVSYLRRLRNEQDPVRARALTALARVGPHLLAPQAAEPLAQIAGDALATRDASGQTRQALSTLAVTVLRRHASTAPLFTWSLRTLEQVFGHRLPALGRIDTQLRRGQEAEVFAAIEGWLKAGLRRGSYDALFAITRALGRRAWRLPELQDMLRRAVSTRNVSSVMRQGTALWLADPASRSQRVEHVLRTDSSTVTLPEVWAALGNRRTDLLDLVLTGPPPRGKFLAAGVRWVPLRASNVRRWLPRQQASYAALLAVIAADGGATIYARTGAIAAAAQIPDVGWDVAYRYIDSTHTNLAEAALAALARTGRPADALPILLGHAGDDRARVAVYAAGAAARYLPPSQLQPILTAEPLIEGKLTSRKEALRLAAILSIPDAGSVLYRAWTQQGQHRDVRAAVAAAARQRLHDPASWPILEEAAAGSPEEALAVAMMASPLRCAPRYRRPYGQLIARTCASSDQHVARAAWLAVPSWADWAPGIASIVAARLAAVADRSLWPLAVPALAGLLGTGRSGPMLRDVTSRLAALDIAGADHDEPGRDRPARQRLRVVIEHASIWAGHADPDLDRAPLADAGRHLCQQPDFTLAGATLLLAAVQLHHGRAHQLAGELTEICDLVADQPIAASQLASALARRAAAETSAEPGMFSGAAAILGQDGRLSAGLFAVALAGYGARLGWPAPWRAQIHQLRGHHLADVRTAALSTVMAVE